MSNDKNGLQPIPEIVEIKDETTGEDKTDWKALALAQNEAAKQYEGLSRRNFTDLEKLRSDPRLKEEEKPKATAKTNDGFDYGQLAYLASKGVSDEDMDFLQEEVKTTGKELKDILGFKYVQEELKTRKESRETQDALPTSKRSSGASHDSVDYWVKKGEMPNRDGNPELYRKVRKEKERLDLERNKYRP